MINSYPNPERSKVESELYSSTTLVNFLLKETWYSVVCSSKWSSSWLLSISILHHDQRLGVDWQLSNLNAIETQVCFWLLVRIKLGPLFLIRIKMRKFRANVCRKVEKATITKCVFKSPNKNSCRPAAAADKCGWIFRGNPFSKYPSQKINDYPRKNIQHQYWVIYHFI